MLGKVLIGLLTVAGLFVIYQIFAGRNAMANTAGGKPRNDAPGRWDPSYGGSTSGVISSSDGSTFKFDRTPQRGQTKFGGGKDTFTVQPGIVSTYVNSPTRSNAGAKNPALAAATNRAKSRAVRGGY